jgi:hypothetical protein
MEWRLHHADLELERIERASRQAWLLTPARHPAQAATA